jgi:hypothetical protein
MNRRALKNHVLRILENPDLEAALKQLKECDSQKLLNPLFIALCSPLERVRWNAVSCFGQTVPRLAELDLEQARVVMRRFLWMLNDESGGIGWGVPESMAEVMANEARLFAEYSHMLISYMRDDGEELFQDGNFLELPLLQRGLLWGIARLSTVYPEEMREKGVVSDLVQYLHAEDETVAATALYCLSLLGEKELASLLPKPLSGRRLRLYTQGEFIDVDLDSAVAEKA